MFVVVQFFSVLFYLSGEHFPSSSTFCACMTVCFCFQKSLVMRVRINYKVNDKDVLEEGQINNFPRDLWGNGPTLDNRTLVNSHGKKTSFSVGSFRQNFVTLFGWSGAAIGLEWLRPVPLGCLFLLLVSSLKGLLYVHCYKKRSCLPLWNQTLPCEHI